MTGDCLHLTEDEKTIDELKARVRELERENEELRKKAEGWVIRINGVVEPLRAVPDPAAHCTTFSAGGAPVPNGEYCDEHPGCVLQKGHGRMP